MHACMDVMEWNGMEWNVCMHVCNPYIAHVYVFHLAHLYSITPHV